MITPATEPLTDVELIWLERRVEHWIRFGHDVAEQILDRRRRILSFAPGSLFAYVRWASNDYGTVVSRIDILRASGWPKVQRVLEAVDAVERLGIDPANVCPDYWRHIHNRLAAGETWRPYTREHHRPWRLCRRVDA